MCRIFVLSDRKATCNGCVRCGADRKEVAHLTDVQLYEKAGVSCLHDIQDTSFPLFITNIICPFWQRDRDRMLSKCRNRTAKGNF